MEDLRNENQTEEIQLTVIDTEWTETERDQMREHGYDDMDMLRATGNEDVIFMHCLPSFHDFETTMAKTQMELGYDIREVTDEVFIEKLYSFGILLNTGILNTNALFKEPAVLYMLFMERPSV